VNGSPSPLDRLTEERGGSGRHCARNKGWSRGTLPSCPLGTVSFAVSETRSPYSRFSMTRASTSRTSVLPVASALLLAGFLVQGLHAQDSRPKLSEDIRHVLESDGPQAATKRFHELFPARKDDYDVDQKGLGDLAKEVMQKGDFTAGQAVMEMLSAVVQETLAGMNIEIPEVPTPPQTPSPPSVQDDRTNRVPDSQAAGSALGPSRTDLHRFAGVYGTPDDVQARRTLFVSVSCEGHLVSGAMWGDASNWWLKSESDHVFATREGGLSVRLEFALGPDGKATAVRHDLDFMQSPLPRVGPLPPEMSDCVPTPWG